MAQTCDISRANESANECANGLARRSYVPNVDIVEVEGDAEVLVDLPGATPESVQVSYEDGLLTIDASVPARQAEGTKYLLREYGVGDFHRSFRVANTVDASRIEATVRDGVMTLKLPKAETAKPKRIEVKTG